MEMIFRTPANWILALLLVDAAAASGWRGVRHLLRSRRGEEPPSPALSLVRGIRGLIVAAAFVLLAAGVLLESAWLLIFGAIFLLEELYETGFVILALRSGEKSGANK